MILDSLKSVGNADCRPGSRALAGVVLALAMSALVALPCPAAAEKQEPSYDKLSQALKKGKLGVSLRYRYENVADDTPAVATKDGNASTLRTSLSYRSGRYRGFGVFLEFEDVSDVGLDDQHNNAGAGALSNAVTGRPVIADPDVTETNQAYLRYSAVPATVITAGRQQIKLGNQRFVGNVGWRQGHQTFDALRVTQESIPRTALNYAYLANVNRVFGDNKQMQSHLLDATVEVTESGRLAPYVYLLDYEMLGDAGLSTTTYGARWTDKPACGRGWSFPYHVELARQTDGGDNPADVSAGYARVEIGAARKSWWIKTGYELLEGDPIDGRFLTPLATLHAFNGWADKFLVTPPNGLEDLFLAVGGARRGVSAMLVYHDFSSDSGGLDYGTEIDLQVKYKAPWQQSFGFKAAFFDADTFAADTDKLWVWTGYSF